MKKNGIIEKSISINELKNLNERRIHSLNKEFFFYNRREITGAFI